MPRFIGTWYTMPGWYPWRETEVEEWTGDEAEGTRRRGGRRNFDFDVKLTTKILMNKKGKGRQENQLNVI